MREKEQVGVEGTPNINYKVLQGFNNMFAVVTDDFVREIQRSGLFDKEFYEASTGEYFESIELAIKNFGERSVKEDARPNASFSPLEYCHLYPESWIAGQHPFYHYVKFGIGMGHHQSFSYTHSQSQCEGDSKFLESSDSSLEFAGNQSGAYSLAAGIRDLSDGKIRGWVSQDSDSSGLSILVNEKSELELKLKAKTKRGGAIELGVIDWVGTLDILGLATEVYSADFESCELRLKNSSCEQSSSVFVLYKKDLIAELISTWDGTHNGTLSLYKFLDDDFMSQIDGHRAIVFLIHLEETKLFKFMQPHKVAKFKLSFAKILGELDTSALVKLIRLYPQAASLLAPYLNQAHSRLMTAILKCVDSMDLDSRFILLRQLSVECQSLAGMIRLHDTDQFNYSIRNTQSFEELESLDTAFHSNPGFEFENWVFMIWHVFIMGWTDQLFDLTVPDQAIAKIDQLLGDDSKVESGWVLTALILAYRVIYVQSDRALFVLIRKYIDWWLGSSSNYLSAPVVELLGVVEDPGADSLLKVVIEESEKREWYARGSIISAALARLEMYPSASPSHREFAATAFYYFGLDSQFVFGIDCKSAIIGYGLNSWVKEGVESSQQVLTFFNELSDEKACWEKLTYIVQLTASLEVNPPLVDRFNYAIYLYAKQHFNEVDVSNLFQLYSFLGSYDKRIIHSIDRCNLECDRIDKSEWALPRTGLSVLYRRVIEARRAGDSDVVGSLINELRGVVRYLQRDQGSLAEGEGFQLIKLVVSEMLYYGYASGYDSLMEVVEPLLLESYLSSTERFEVELQLVYAKALCENVTKEYRFSKRVTNYLRLHQLDEDENSLLTFLRPRAIFPYTTILVYSCSDYLDSRVAGLERTWISNARALGIDVNVVVGGADNASYHNGLITLPVNDSYEALPDKTLAMFEYASSLSGAQFFHKIDDDCLLNVDSHFSDPTYFNHDYWGRRVVRGLGDVDRDYHQVKSSTIEAAKSYDLSPEGSIYADGGTGYVLSRKAVRKLIMSASAHKSLVKDSYFEDKLVGDLLKKMGVELSSESMDCVVRRKISPATSDIESFAWEYNFLPTPENNVRVLHSESPSFLADVWEANFASNSNEGRMLGPRIISNEKIDTLKIFDGSKPQSFVEECYIQSDLRDANKVVILVGKNELSHLPAILEHHRSIGFDQFIYIDNGSSDGSVEYMLGQSGVSVLTTILPYSWSRFSVDWVDAVLMNYCIGKWVLVVDADEFFVFDSFESKDVNDLINLCESEGANSIYSSMIDFYANDRIVDAHLGGAKYYEYLDHFDSITSMTEVSTSATTFNYTRGLTGGLRGRVFGHSDLTSYSSYSNQKTCMFKFSPELFLTEGLHQHYGRKVYSKRCGLMHFKYHSGFGKKVLDQLDSGQHWNGSFEYKMYLSKLKADEDLNLFDDNISIKYDSSISLVDAGYLDSIDWANGKSLGDSNER